MKKIEKIIEYSESVHLYKFPFNKNVKNVNFISKTFFDLIKNNTDSFKKNLMRIYLKIDGNKSNDYNIEEIADFLKNSFGYIVAEENLNFNDEKAWEKIYGYIYTHKWGGKDEISFWKKESVRNINFKAIIGIFLKKYFEREEIQLEESLVWGTRYLAHKSNNLAHQHGFENVFSFYDYIEEFKDQYEDKDDKKNMIDIPINSETKGVVLTNYFYSNKNRFLFKNKKKQDYCEEKRDEKFENTPFFSYFQDWKNFENPSKYNEFSSEQIESNDCKKATLEENKILLIDCNSKKEYYYFSSFNNAHKKIESKSNESIEFHAFNIILTNELSEKISIKFEFKKDKRIKKVGIIFHIINNVLQISCFDKQNNCIFSKAWKKFESKLSNDYFKNENTNFINNILNNKVSIIYGEKKSGITSFVNNNLEEALKSKGKSNESSLLYFESKEFVSPEKTLDDINDFLQNNNKFIEDLNPKNKNIWRRVFNKISVSPLSHNLNLIILASFPILTSSLIAIISSFNDKRDIDLILVILLSVLLLSIAIIYPIYKKFSYESLNNKAKRNLSVHKESKNNKAKRNLSMHEESKNNILSNLRSTFVIDGIDLSNFNYFLKLIPFLKFYELSKISFVFVISDDSSERIAKEIQKVINNASKNKELKISLISFETQNSQKQSFILREFMTDIYIKNREHILAHYKDESKGEKIFQEDNNIGNMYKAKSEDDFVKKYNYDYFIPKLDKDLIDDCFSILSFFAIYIKSYSQIEHLFNKIRESINLHFSNSRIIKNNVQHLAIPILDILTQSCLNVLYNEYHREEYIIKSEKQELSEKNKELKSSFIIRSLENKEKWTEEIQSKFIKW